MAVFHSLASLDSLREIGNALNEYMFICLPHLGPKNDASAMPSVMQTSCHHRFVGWPNEVNAITGSRQQCYYICLTLKTISRTHFSVLFQNSLHSKGTFNIQQYYWSVLYYLTWLDSGHSISLCELNCGLSLLWNKMHSMMASFNLHLSLSHKHHTVNYMIS